MGVLGTLSGRCVRVQEAAHPAIRRLEPGFPCEQHTYAHAVVPLVCPRSKSVCAEVPTAVCTEWPQTGKTTQHVPCGHSGLITL